MSNSRQIQTACLKEPNPQTAFPIFLHQLPFIAEVHWSDQDSALSLKKAKMSSSESESVEKPRHKSSKSDHSSKKRKREESETKSSKKGGEEVQIKFEIRHCEPSECPPLIGTRHRLPFSRFSIQYIIFEQFLCRKWTSNKPQNSSS